MLCVHFIHLTNNNKCLSSCVLQLTLKYPNRLVGGFLINNTTTLKISLRAVLYNVCIIHNFSIHLTSPYYSCCCCCVGIYFVVYCRHPRFCCLHHHFPLEFSTSTLENIFYKKKRKKECTSTPKNNFPQTKGATF